MVFKKTHKEDLLFGTYGEKYAQMKLSVMGLDSIKLPNSFDFDLYTNNNLRIEVKIAKLSNFIARHNKNGKTYSYPINFWHFNNHQSKDRKFIKRDRKCDFFIFICVDKRKILGSYIIPKDKINNARSIRIYKNRNNKKYGKYLEKWSQLKETEEI